MPSTTVTRAACAAVVSLLAVAGAHSGTNGAAAGVVVETVEQGGAAARGGVRSEDVLVAWRRGASRAGDSAAAEGRLASPFDLLEVEIEQAPLGRITLLVERPDEPAAIEIPGGSWMLRARPRFSSGDLEAYRRAARDAEAGEWRRASAALTSLADRAGRSRLEAAWMRHRAAEWLARAEAWEDARARYDRAAQSAGDEARLAFALRHLEGEAWEKRFRYAEAERAFEQALGLTRGVSPGGLAAATAHFRLGKALVQRGDLPAGQREYQEALTILESRAPRSADAARVLTWLAVSFTRRSQPGDFAQAEALLTRARGILQEIAPESLDMAVTLNSSGNVARLAAGVTEAETRYRQALAVCERAAPSSLTCSAILANLGGIAWSRGDVAGHRRYYERALEIQERHAPGSLALAATLNNLGNLAGQRGDLAVADDLLGRALEIRRRAAPESEEVAHVLNNLGVVACWRRDYRSAERYFRKSLQIRQRLAPGSLNVATCLENLGYVMAKRGDLASAVEHYRRALAVAERVAPGGGDAASALRDLADSLRERGDYDAAEDHLRRALDIRTRVTPGGMEVAEILYSLGETAAGRGNRQAALDFHRRALGIRERLAPGSHSVADSAAALARLHREGWESEAALAFFRRSVDALETQQGRLGGVLEDRTEFRASQAGIYKDLVNLLADLDRGEEAFHLLERFLAQGFLSLLSDRDLLLEGDVPEELERERRLLAADFDRVQERLGGLSPDKDLSEVESSLAELQQIRRHQADLREEIGRRAPRAGGLRYPAPLDLAGARRALDPGTALLSYSVGPDSTRLFAIDGGGVLFVERIPAGEAALRDRVRLFRESIAASRGGPRVAEVERQGEELYGTLIAPVAGRLASAKRLLIVPDGPLHLLPFAALVRPAEGDAGRRRYVVEWLPIHLVASVTVYEQLRGGQGRGTAPSSPTLLAFGDPRYPSASPGAPGAPAEPELLSVLAKGRSLKPLPASREEVRAIAGLFEDGARVFLGAEATEETARTVAGGSRLIHFAAHGLVDPVFPLDSAIALSVPETVRYGRDNGLLQAWEIFESLRIDADLVTLSACETALGREVAGEGIVGLTRAFQYAGAKSVLASLWSVADESTAELMKRFYGYLGRGRSKDEALQAAQIDLIRASGGDEDRSTPRGIGRPETDRDRTRRRSSPFHWAAFQLYGDCR